MTATPNVPIVNARVKYVNGLALSWASNTTLTLGTGACSDTTNTNDIVLGSAATLNVATTGANALDTGTVAASTMYAIYAIGDSTGYHSAAGLISLAASAAPTLPFGYDMYRRVGWALTDGSSHFLLFWQFGIDERRTYYYDVVIAELSGGSSTTYANIDLATSVPPEATQVMMLAAYTPNSATNVAHFLPYGSAATNGIVQIGGGVAAAQVSNIVLPCRLNSGVPTVQYKVQTSDALTLSTEGYVDLIS